MEPDERQREGSEPGQEPPGGAGRNAGGERQPGAGTGADAGTGGGADAERRGGFDASARAKPSRASVPSWLVLLVILLGVIVGVLALAGAFDKPPPKVSPVKSDMRSLATALESYMVDNCSYPAMIPLGQFAGVDLDRLRKAGGENLSIIDVGGSLVTDRAGLTTPIAYATSLFIDPFSPGRNLPFAYYNDFNGWILLSPGPDGDYDIVPERDYTSTILQPSEHLLAVAGTYDPTNGTHSDGDIWRVKQ